MLSFYLLFFGILTIAYSAIRCLRVFKYVRISSYRNLWRVLFGLIVAFLFGYFAFLLLHFSNVHIDADFLTVIIFAAGSIYVLMTVDLIYRTLEEDAILQRTTQEYAEKLEEMFQKKAVDLQNKNMELRTMITELTDSKKAMLNILEDMNFSEDKLKDALEKIQVKENEEQAILKSIGSGLLVVNDKGIVLEINKTAETNFGIKREEILHQSVKGMLGFEELENTLLDFSLPVSRKTFRMEGKKISCMVKGGKLYCRRSINKLREECKSCSIFKADVNKIMNLNFSKTTGLIFSAVISPIIADADGDNDHGFVVGQVLTMNDITKEIEMNKAKDVFLSITSHELRTPMTAISGNLRMVLDGEAGKIDNYTKEFLEDAYSGSQRLLTLVEDMLNVSRIEQGRMVYHMSNFNIVKSTDRVIEYLKNIARKKGLYIKYSSKNQNMLVSGDEGKVSEVLTNLVGNSLKFTEKGGITINQKVKGKFLITYVSDTGVGLKKEDRPSLFQKFSQVNLTLTNQKGGTGLGLYICRQYMKAMSGDIWIEKSVFGEGTTFAFSLPIVKKNVKEQGNLSTRKRTMV